MRSISSIGVLHLVDRFLVLVLGELLVAPVLVHAAMQEILVDRGELVVQRLVEVLDDFGVALHRDLPWWRRATRRAMRASSATIARCASTRGTKIARIRACDEGHAADGDDQAAIAISGRSSVRARCVSCEDLLREILAAAAAVRAAGAAAELGERAHARCGGFADRAFGDGIADADVHGAYLNANANDCQHRGWRHGRPRSALVARIDNPIVFTAQ